MDELVLLVQSMTWTEKRYFRKYARRHQLGEENRYLELFGALEKSSPDKSSGAMPNKTAALRSYLQKMILRSLREYHHQSSVEMELRSMLDYLDLIADRWLPGIQSRLLSKGLAMAKASGLPQYHLEFQRRRRKHIRVERRPEKVQILDEILGEEQEALDQYRAEFSWLHKYDQEYLLAQAITESNPIAAKQQEPSDQEEPGSFNGALAFFSSQAIRAIRQGNYAEAKDFFGHNLKVWEKFPIHIKDHPRRYISAVMNYLSSCHRCEEYEEFARALGEITLGKHLNRQTQAILNLKTHDLALLLRTQTMDWEGAREAVEKLDAMLNKDKFDEILELTTSWNLAMFYFSQEEYGDSLKWINHILNRPRNQTRQDLLRSAPVIEIVLHFERGNIDYMLSRMRSLERLPKSKAIPPAARELFRCLRKVIRTGSRQVQKEAFSSFYTKLETLKEAEQIAGITELKYWVQHRITGQSTVEVMRSDH